MKFLLASLIALGAWQCNAAEILKLSEDEIQSISPVGECPPVDGAFPVLLPDSSNKTIFYICSNGKPIAMSCPDGLEFSSALKTCVFPRTFSPIGECPLVDGPKPTYLPDSENNTIFYECSNGVPILMFCYPGLVFNPVKEVCDWPNTRKEQQKEKCPETDVGSVILLPDEDECSKYYVCFGGKAFEANCPEGLLFNPEMNYCDYPQNVKCNEDKDKDEDEDEEQ